MVIAGKKSRDPHAYHPVALEGAVGRTVEAVGRAEIGGDVPGEDVCVSLYFTDGTYLSLYVPFDLLSTEDDEDDGL